MADAKTLYLIDGSGFIFRAYYGIRAPMSATDGTPTNAVYGFTRLVVNLIRDRSPEYVIVAFDPPGPTFRNTIYPEYKANRSEPPDDLKPQFSMCRDATLALGLASMEKSGYEADDVIGTLAQRWSALDPENRCVIVTADKDMMQLVTDRVSLWDGKEKESAHDEVVEKFGVPPKAVIDVLGLAGDSSDNIPASPGSDRRLRPRCFKNTAISRRSWPLRTRSRGSGERTCVISPSRHASLAGWRPSHATCPSRSSSNPRG